MSSKLTPGGVPVPIICPGSLMYLATDRCKEELTGIKVFKSIIGPPCSHKKALASLGTKLILDPPTTWPLELIDCAELVAPRFPRSVITPDFQKKALCNPFGKSARPHPSPPSLMAEGLPLLPPKVPRSVSVPSLQR